MKDIFENMTLEKLIALSDDDYDKYRLYLARKAKKAKKKIEYDIASNITLKKIKKI